MRRKLCVVGNPNCGKTTLFNALTGSHQTVGNWPGVTVEKITGHYEHQGIDYELIDLPGIYSLTSLSHSGEDERIARDFILSHEAEAVINIVDATNMERNLYLTAQLIEMRVPMLVVVNMLDIAKKRHIDIRIDELSHALGCPVIGVVASREQGLFALKEMIAAYVTAPSIPPLTLQYDERIEAAHAAIEKEITNVATPHPHWLAIELLEGANGAREALAAETALRVKPIIQATQTAFGADLDVAVADARFSLVARVCERVVSQRADARKTLTDRIDQIVLNRFLGLPIFLVVMYVMFLFTQNIGSAFIDFFDILVGGVMVEGLGNALSYLGIPEVVKVILADGVGGGLQTVSTFIPVLFCLFFFLAILEDSGYMARAAFVMDRLMRSIGLPGKAFVPLIVGFGCNVPAILATRTMDRVTDRILTILMVPFMSCGARLPVYVLFATAFFPRDGENLIFLLYLIGIGVAIVTGFLMKRLVFPGVVSSFVMEIPAYHIPTFKGVMVRTWERLKGFILRAGHVIVVIVACLTILNSMGTDGSFGNEDTEQSVLSAIGQTISPVLSPLGIEKENWPAAVGIFTGILAKESVVGTMNSLYDAMVRTENREQEKEKARPWRFKAILSQAIQSVKDNLQSLWDETDKKSAGAGGGIAVMQKLFASDLVALSYMLLILLYTPCSATLAAIWHEVGSVWTAFVALWTTALGFGVATVTYRIGTFHVNPSTNLTYIGIVLAVLVAILVGVHQYAKKERAGGKRTIRIYPAD